MVLDLIEAAVRTGRHAEVAAHVVAVEEAGVAQLAPCAALLATAAAAVAGTDVAAAGELFGRALAVPGADRWPFELVASAGLTNRQSAQHLLISRRTVDARLYRSFAELGISTCAALPDAIESPPAVPADLTTRKSRSRPASRHHRSPSSVM